MVTSFTRGSLYNDASAPRVLNKIHARNEQIHARRRKKGSKGHEEAAPRQIPVT